MSYSQPTVLEGEFGSYVVKVDKKIQTDGFSMYAYSINDDGLLTFIDGTTSFFSTIDANGNLTVDNIQVTVDSFSFYSLALSSVKFKYYVVTDLNNKTWFYVYKKGVRLGPFITDLNGRIWNYGISPSGEWVWVGDSQNPINYQLWRGT